ncbi:hypothetical protein HOY82DRAFT_642057 [Tuber indicum]|nr:hypothetical protein HOY82DRAFT_642057 [Tuber indicum]
MDLTFSILSVADVCSRTGQNLFGRYQETRNANRDLDNLGIRMETIWIAIASRLEMVQGSPEAVPDSYRVRMEKHLDRLLYLFHTSYRNHEKATNNNRWTVTETIKFALFQKRSLEKDVSALQKWRDKFDSTFPALSIPQGPGLECFP